MDQYTYQKLRGRLRGAATVDPFVRDVCNWRTDQAARARIAASPQAHAKAAARVMADVATEDQIVEVLGPCFLSPLGEMRLRLVVKAAMAERPMTAAQALAELIGLCERNAVITATDLAKYKKVLE